MRLFFRWSSIATCVFAASLVTMAAMRTQQQSERASGPPPFARAVGYMADLRARTPEERAKATFFERVDRERLKPGHSISIGGIMRPVPPPGLAAPTYEAFLREVVCRGDALIVGTAAPKDVLLNVNESFLFTEYEIAVRRWLSPGREGAPTVVLSMEGGRAIVGGRLTETTIGTPIVPETEYLLVLRRIPGAQGFALARIPASSLEPPRISMAQFRLPNELLGDAVTFDKLVDDLANLTPARCNSGANR